MYTPPAFDAADIILGETAPYEAPDFDESTIVLETADSLPGPIVYPFVRLCVIS